MAALARVLTGDAEPGGRLPFTVPAAETDVPVARPTADRVHYDEGLEVGYRAYDRRGIEPAFPFGHGLGFAALTWSDARILADARGIRASALVTNTSKHDGVAVPQLYVTSPGGHRALRGFDSVRVPAGASVAIDIEVPLDDLAGYSADGWRIAPGEHRVELATSSRTSIHEARVDVLGHAE